MAAELLSPPAPALDANGSPYSGATWEFFATGTSTPQAVYADAGLSTSLGSVVTADSAGRWPDIYFNAALVYRGVCKNASGSVTLHDIDPINSDVYADLLGPTGSDNIGVQQTEYAHAPAINLTKWIEGGVVNAKQQALPASFDFATDDSWQYLQNLAADMESIGARNRIALTGSDTWRLGSQLVFGSDAGGSKGSALVGVGGKPILLWTGATMNTVTQDDKTGAMVLFDGYDHAWGGLENLVFFAQSKANFCAWVAGYITPGFKLDNLHMQHAQLDCLAIRAAGETGIVNTVINSFTAYPYTEFGGVNGVCGRDVISFHINGSDGMAVVRDANIDNGVNSGIRIKAGPDFAGHDFVFEGFRFEQNRTDGDLLVLDYDSGVTSPGTITFRNVKLASGGGNTLNLVHNKTLAAKRPDIQFDPLTGNVGPTNIYKDDYDDGKSVAFSSDLYRKFFRIEHSAAAGAYPSVARAIGDQALIYATATPTAVTKADANKRFTNEIISGALKYDLPPIAAGLGSPGVPVGWRCSFTARLTGVITLDAAGSDTISGGGTLVSSGNIGDEIDIMVAAPGAWIVTSKVGTWT